MGGVGEHGGCKQPDAAIGIDRVLRRGGLRSGALHRIDEQLCTGVARLKERGGRHAKLGAGDPLDERGSTSGGDVGGNHGPARFPTLASSLGRAPPCGPRPVERRYAQRQLDVGLDARLRECVDQFINGDRAIVDADDVVRAGRAKTDTAIWTAHHAHGRAIPSRRHCATD